MRKEEELLKQIELLTRENAKLKSTLKSTKFELRLFDLLLEHFPDNIYFKNTDTTFIKVSKAMAKQFHSSQQQMIGKSDFDFFPKDLASVKHQDDMEVIQQKKEIRNKVEVDKHNPDSAEMWVSSTKVPMYDTKGLLIGLMGISRNITNEKKAEDGRKKALAEKSRLLKLLEKTTISRDYLENILNSLSEALFVISESGHIKIANQTACKISGYKIDELIGFKVRDLIKIKGERNQIWDKEKISYEVILKNKTGRQIPCLFSLALFTDNHETSRICVFTDITRRKEAETKLQQLNETLEEKVIKRTKELEKAYKELQLSQQEIQVQNEELLLSNEEILTQRDQIENQNKFLMQTQVNLDEANKKLTEMNQQLESRVKERTANLLKSNKELDKFVYSASHDLSAPLKSVLGLINLTRNEKEAELKAECLDRMEFSIHKLEDVIKSLIQYSRNSRSELKYEPFFLKGFIEEIYSQLQFSEEGRKFDFSIDFTDDFQIISDKQRLKTVLSNVLSNGIKYQDTEKANSYIKVSAEFADNSCIIYVKDNGIGINKSVKKEIFNMFYRGSTLSFGSGLGLFIARETVQKLGGKISVKSKEGEGSTFIIRLNQQNI